MNSADKIALAAFIRDFSEAAGLGHSAERLKELEPEITALFEDMKRLWSISVDELEPAIGFAVEGSESVG